MRRVLAAAPCRKKLHCRQEPIHNALILLLSFFGIDLAPSASDFGVCMGAKMAWCSNKPYMVAGFAAAIAAVAAANDASAGPNSVTTEIDKYLIIGTGSSNNTVNLNSSKELGANQVFLSTTDPNLKDTFFQNGQRWTSPTAPPSPAAPVFVGKDFSGNVALTNNVGYAALLHGENDRAKAYFVRAMETSPHFLEAAYESLHA